jgi:hypothetical protein
LPTVGSKRCSTNNEPLVIASPNMNTSRPDNWWRATPVRPRIPNVNARLAAVLAIAVSNSAVRFAACAPIAG